MKHTTCSHCAEGFSIFDEDLRFYAKVGVPAPKMCPDCREQRRQAYINQIHLFKRRCDGTGKSIVASYPERSPYTVFDQEYWYSDAVDNTEHGRPVDFSQPFFPQFAALQRVVPRPNLFTDFARDENSDYTNFAGRNKNCYLIFDSDENWDCYYGYSMNSCRSSVECYRVENLELCREVIDSRKCYNSSFLQNCESCVDSAFLTNCIGCKNCIASSNLRQKQFYAFNEPVSEAEYRRLWNALRDRTETAAILVRYRAHAQTFPQKAMLGFQVANATGNYLTNTKDAFWCFDCRDLWSGRYCFQSFMPLKDCMDINECGEAELLYECSNFGYNAFNCRFSTTSLNQLTNLTYCELCFNGCSDLFGCVGLKKKQYCILNKQYSKEDYTTLVGRLVAHMESTGEWGEFFPPICSTQPYNRSVAQSFFPLTKEQAIAQGFSWEDEPEASRTGASSQPPSSLDHVTPQLAQETFSCRKCSRRYKIIQQELELYLRQGWAVPDECFLCRHEARFALRIPRALWQRTCGRCSTELVTAFPPTRPEPVYCEPCYLDSLD